MSIFVKLNTLFRAGGREAAEALLDANSLRVYEQEIVDAESMLLRQREGMAVRIASREELAREINQVEQQIRKAEEKAALLIAAEKQEHMLELAAAEIATLERRLAALREQHQECCREIDSDEARLRGLVGEIKQHRRDLKLLRSQEARHGGSRSSAGNTLAARLQALRDSRQGIRERLAGNNDLEAGVEEVARRLDQQPFEQALQEQGLADEQLHRDQVLARLKERLAPGNGVADPA